MTEIQWTPHESALWRTCELLVGASHGQMPPPVPVEFAMQMGHDERVVAWGDFERSWYGAAGDGSYRSSTFVAGGLGPGGLLLGGLTLGGSALGNSARKARARQEATAMWRPFDLGRIFISTHGWYLDTGAALLAFPFSSVVRADLGAPGVLEHTCSMDSGGQDMFALTTVWAELLFALWAGNHCPHHPRMANLGWLPRAFIDRVDASGLWPKSPLAALGSSAGRAIDGPRD